MVNTFSAVFSLNGRNVNKWIEVSSGHRTGTYKQCMALSHMHIYGDSYMVNSPCYLANKQKNDVLDFYAMYYNTLFQHLRVTLSGSGGCCSY